MSEEKVNRCIQCNKIIVGKSQMGLCPRCADKDKKGFVGIAAAAGAGFLAVKKYGKPVAEFLISVAKRG